MFEKFLKFTSFVSGKLFFNSIKDTKNLTNEMLKKTNHYVSKIDGKYIDDILNQNNSMYISYISKEVYFTNNIEQKALEVDKVNKQYISNEIFVVNDDKINVLQLNMCLEKKN